MFDLPARYMSKVQHNAESSCWEWTGNRNAQGHGRYFHCGRLDYAHRVMLESLGIYTKGALVRHTCDNARCVNPLHLLIGTHADNMRDWHERGHGNRGESNGMHRLTAEQVTEIRRLYALVPRSSGGKRARKGTLQRLAEAFGVTTSCINLIVHRHEWKST